MKAAIPWAVIDPGIRTRLPARVDSRRALFLDRDGVVVEDCGYLADPANVRLLPGAAALVSAANRRRIPVVVVTNQSGIARGLFDWSGFAAVEAAIERDLAAAGAVLDGVIACPFHPDFTPGYGPAHARFRKPGPGMIEFASERLGLNRGACWLVGNDRRDGEAAEAAGLAGAILLDSADVTHPPIAQERKTRFRLEHCRGLPETTALLERVLFND